MVWLGIAPAALLAVGYIAVFRHDKLAGALLPAVVAPEMGFAFWFLALFLYGLQGPQNRHE